VNTPGHGQGTQVTSLRTMIAVLTELAMKHCSCA
jgi:hypothetical protein